MNRIGHNDRLRDLRHTSSIAVIEFILLISDYLSNRIVSEVKQTPWLATMVDDTTDIITLQQYIIFIRYVNARRGQSTAFLNIRQRDAHGASAVNLFRLWNEVAIDYNLYVVEHAAIACDGAAAMIAVEILCLKN